VRGVLRASGKAVWTWPPVGAVDAGGFLVKHGYDTNYAMHVIRLYGKAKELMEHGRITLPRSNRDELVEIRKGQYSLSEIRQLGEQLESEAPAAQATSPLPDKVDRDAISWLLADAHLRFWSESKN
jgi:uncharacterized protein